jgi:hypothetical protein
MLTDPVVDIPFCLCWANENWTKKWDGGNEEMIMKQSYGREREWKRHFDYLLPFFQDERYIKIDGKPVFVIYRPHIIPRVIKMLSFFRKQAAAHKLPGIVFMDQKPEWIYERTYDPSIVDYNIMFEPFFSYHTSRDRLNEMIIRKYEKLNKAKFIDRFELDKTTSKYTLIRYMKKNRALRALINFSRSTLRLIERFLLDLAYRIGLLKDKFRSLEILGFDECWDCILNDCIENERLIPGAFVGFDNTPRIANGVAITGATPEKFEMYLKKLFAKPSQTKFVFVNAWNEWAESAYLEPDERYRYGYLEAVRNALEADEHS